MQTFKSLCVSTIILGLLLSVSPNAFADEPSVEVIDNTNWQKVEGLVPEVLLEWVKTGEFILPLGELSYDLIGLWPSHYLESRTANIGKYALDETGVIVDAKTGKLAKSVIGIPFPDIDPADPQAGTKIIYNKAGVTNGWGNKRFNTTIAWIGGGSGFEREIQATFVEGAHTGSPGALEYPNPKDFEKYSIISVRSPYDLAGTSVMLWRYLDNRSDLNFSYIPAIRRVRRSTPANRSDGFVGSDFTVDDAAAYDGKVPAFEWKLIGKQEGLMNFGVAYPMPMSINKKGEWVMKPTVGTRYGYTEKGASVAPWCPLDSVYVKRPVWVIEAKAKDPYYNAGVQYIWIDTETWFPLYKMTHDRAGKFWKFILMTTVGQQTADKKAGTSNILDHIVVDKRRDHASHIKQMFPGNKFVFFADLDLNDFSLAGFQKYCK